MIRGSEWYLLFDFFFYWKSFIVLWLNMTILYKMYCQSIVKFCLCPLLSYAHSAPPTHDSNISCWSKGPDGYLRFDIRTTSSFYFGREVSWLQSLLNDKYVSSKKIEDVFWLNKIDRTTPVQNDKKIFKIL